MPRFGLTTNQLSQVNQNLKQNPDTLIQETLYNHTRQILQQAITRVYGNLPHTHPQYIPVHQMHENLARFAGYKTAWQTADIKNGKNIAATDAKYNVNWLRTEFVHTVRSARQAQNWQRYQQDKDLYPYLEYMPSTAAEPRNQHQRLYGIIKPLDDPFWDTWLPPNDWGCRCSVQQVRSDTSTRAMPTDIKQPPATMRHNPGRTNQIITNRHPMIANVPKKMQQPIDQEYQRIERKAIRHQTIKNARENIVGENHLTPEGEKMIISHAGIKKIVNQNSSNYNLKCRLVQFIPSIVSRAKPVRLEKPIKDRRNIKWIHVYHYPFNDKTIRIILFETHDKKPVFILHAFNFME